MSKDKQSLAFFDFDKTITSTDSFVVFMKYTLGYPCLILGLLIISPVILGFLLKVIPNYRAKEISMRFFFRNWSKERFAKAAARFAEEKLPSIIRPMARDRIGWHKSEGHRVFIVTASFEDWIRPWGESMGIEVIGTILDVDEDDRLTGRFATPNCYGPEKVRRIKEKVNPEEFGRIYAYGDSRGDKEMLELADEPFFRWLK